MATRNFTRVEFFFITLHPQKSNKKNEVCATMHKVRKKCANMGVVRRTITGVFSVVIIGVLKKSLGNGSGICNTRVTGVPSMKNKQTKKIDQTKQIFTVHTTMYVSTRGGALQRPVHLQAGISA